MYEIRLLQKGEDYMTYVSLLRYMSYLDLSNLELNSREMVTRGWEEGESGIDKHDVKSQLYKMNEF